jgi:hypothetical protein
MMQNYLEQFVYFGVFFLKPQRELSLKMLNFQENLGVSRLSVTAWQCGKSQPESSGRLHHVVWSRSEELHSG